ncbi:MAG TPA: hypothetical protein VMF87_11195 [Streptosporangiaceae bacterium]|nr:hypothetical protein [Streptosporangiaceae bacterium]
MGRGEVIPATSAVTAAEMVAGHVTLLLFACFYTRVYDHVLRPLMAPDRPNAPPGLTAARATLDQLTAEHVTRARVPAA